MAQYISKSALVAEIEKRMQELRPTNTHQMQVGEKMNRDVLMWLNALKWVKKVIDTLEVKEEPVSKDLGEYINELSKQFPEVSFAKLSRIAVRAAKWQKENLWKDAQGDDLPEIDREVIALVQDYPDDAEHLRIVYAHRPPEYWNGKNILTGEVTRYKPERHDKGGWNLPNVKYWLDVELPKVEE